MDDRLPSAIQQVAGRVLGRFTSFRNTMRDRIREVDRITQKDVMAAARDVNEIYKVATAQISDLKSRLSSVFDGASTDERWSAEAQLTSVEKYVSDLDLRIRDLKSIASQSAGFTSQIEKAARQIQDLTTNAQMLAINARIEAARSSESSSMGFAVIAVEMKDLSRSISQTSETVKQLAQNLGSLLPSLDSGMSELRRQSQVFSQTLRDDIREAAGHAAAQRDDVATALKSSDVTLSAIVKASQSALSNLQFQDVVAQGLMRLDATAASTETEICKDLGLDARVEAIEKAMHVEIGGEKSVDQKNAGEVLLF